MSNYISTKNFRDNHLCVTSAELIKKRAWQLKINDDYVKIILCNKRNVCGTIEIENIIAERNSV